MDILDVVIFYPEVVIVIKRCDWLCHFGFILILFSSFYKLWITSFSRICTYFCLCAAVTLEFPFWIATLASLCLNLNFFNTDIIIL